MQQPMKSAENAGRGCLLVFALFWTGFSVFWTAMASLGGGLFGLFGLPFIAIGIGLLAWAAKPWVVGMKLGPAEARCQPESLRPGEAFSFTYRQAVRKPVDVTRVTIDFLFRESATYRQGTDTYTVTHDRPIDHYQRAGRRYEVGDTLLEELSWKVPEDGMHSFSASNNKLQWLIRVKIELAGWPDVNETYEVHVRPERSA